MDEFKKWIEGLQNADYKTKIKIMWIGVPIVMAVIIFVWLSFTNFGFQEEKAGPVTVAGQETVSKFEILKNGFAVTLKEIGDLLKDFKEKISQTNTFEITAPEQSLENTASTTNNK